MESCRRHGVSPEKASPLKDGSSIDDLLAEIQVMGEAPLLRLDLRGNYDDEGAPSYYETVFKSHKQGQAPREFTIQDEIRVNKATYATSPLRTEAMRFLLTADEHPVLATASSPMTHHHEDRMGTPSRFDDFFAGPAAAPPATPQ